MYKVVTSFLQIAPKSDKRARSRDHIDVVKTIFWFEGLRIRAGVETAYALERRIEPESFGKNRFGDSIRRNKWGRYRNGQHTPSDKTVAQANRRYSGSATELNHVLWSVLQSDGAIGTYAFEWLRKLDPELQIIIFEQGEYIRIHGGRQYLGKLERRASLDCLAYLIIAARVTSERGLHMQSWEFAQSAFRTLLMLGPIFIQRNLGSQIFKIFVERIFSRITWNGNGFCLQNYDFVQSAQLLFDLSKYPVNEKAQPCSWTDQIKLMYKILSGGCGDTYRNAIAPVIGPDNEIGPLTEEKYRKLNESIKIRNDALNEVLNCTESSRV